MDKLDAILENKVLKKATTGAADALSLASENQPAAKARLNGDIHHRPLVSLSYLDRPRSLPDVFILTTQPAPAPSA